LTLKIVSLPQIYTQFGAAHKCIILWHQMVNLAIRKIHIPTRSKTQKKKDKGKKKKKKKDNKYTKIK